MNISRDNSNALRGRNALMQIYAKQGRNSGMLKGSGASIFAGDPVVIDQSGAAATADPSLTNDAVANAVLTGPNAAERAAAFEEMTPSAQADVVVEPVLLLSNAEVQENPVTRHIQSSILNFNLLWCLTHYASSGILLTGNAVEGNPNLTIEFNAAAIAEKGETGLKTVPFFKFMIAASVLTSRPGAVFQIVLSGTTISGQVLTGGGANDAPTTAPFVFTRTDYLLSVVGYMIPFIIVATRSVPVLPIFGQIGNDPAVSFKVTVKGMTVGEQLTAITPGYAQKMTGDIAKLYKLPAGILVM